MVVKKGAGNRENEKSLSIIVTQLLKIINQLSACLQLKYERTSECGLHIFGFFS
jgi:hypothetical protein